MINHLLFSSFKGKLPFLWALEVLAWTPAMGINDNGGGELRARKKNSAAACLVPAGSSFDTRPMRMLVHNCDGRNPPSSYPVACIPTAIAFLLLWIGLASPALAQEITVAAASDLSFALPQLADQFAQQTGHHVRPVFGSSGNLFAQIQNGAPYDVFLSADTSYPRKLLSAGQATAGSYYVYAVGRLALYVRADSPLDLKKLGVHVLLAPSVHRIAIANPEHAPYGRAAVAALQHFGIYQRLKSELVLGENVSQAAQFVLSGNAQVALTALSVARAQSGKFALVPEEAHPPIQQAAVLIQNSPNPEIARSFIRFLASPEAQATLQHFGFQAPAADAMSTGRDKGRR
jgi:molybdate transport system substrate-binding protein